MNPINFKTNCPSQILKKNKYYFLEYFNKGFNKDKLLSKFLGTTSIIKSEFSDITRFTNQLIECLHFTNVTNVRTGLPFNSKFVKLYYYKQKLYAEGEFRLIYHILSQWKWPNIENYRIDACFIYNPIKEEIVLKKIVSDPHFIWNND